MNFSRTLRSSPSGPQPAVSRERKPVQTPERVTPPAAAEQTRRTEQVDEAPGEQEAATAPATEAEPANVVTRQEPTESQAEAQREQQQALQEQRAALEQEQAEKQERIAELEQQVEQNKGTVVRMDEANRVLEEALNAAEQLAAALSEEQTKFASLDPQTGEPVEPLAPERIESLRETLQRLERQTQQLLGESASQ